MSFNFYRNIIVTTTSYKELLAQRDALEKQIADARAQEVSGAIESARKLIAEFGLTQADVFPQGRSSRGQRPSVAPKYRDPATGATWSGRGLPPKWISGKDRAQFAIQADNAQA
jgi:DNA-binding protein H-NS